MKRKHQSAEQLTHKKHTADQLLILRQALDDVGQDLEMSALDCLQLQQRFGGDWGEVPAGASG